METYQFIYYKLISFHGYEKHETGWKMNGNNLNENHGKTVESLHISIYYTVKKYEMYRKTLPY